MPILVVLFVFQCSEVGAKGKKDKKSEGYQFTNIVDIPTTTVKDQGSTGTCWSYATTSFIETEIIRLGNGEHDLSEMFFVRHVYSQKAVKYLRYQGLANFSQGGQAHDVFNVIKEYGIVPDANYTGLDYGLDNHKHGEMVRELTGILDNSIESTKGYTGKSLELFNAGLDIYLGELPESFSYNEGDYSAVSFANKMGIVPEDYIEFTSYSIYPFYEKVDLEIPDNWSHDDYFNIPIDDLMSIISNAFENGYSVNWDGDVSESGFSHRKGVAIVPEKDPQQMDDSERAKWEALSEKEKSKMLYDFSKPRKEMMVDQVTRQKTFDNYKTTDDHLMHLVGTATDQNGTLYYNTKNSWADDSNKMGGRLYMSESYIRLKTIAIQVHKDAIPLELKTKLKIE